MIYHATGLMSGTSLDGLDLAHCVFEHQGGRWRHHMVHAETLSYPLSWENKLRKASRMDAPQLMSLHMAYGAYLGHTVRQWRRKHQIPGHTLLASHGHTIFHRPSAGFTFQLGHGAALAAAAQCTVVSDFRSLDVALGGQGAPLVPLGDQVLFSDYGICLNLGGFANISYQAGDHRLAFDVCPLNFVLNRLIRSARIPASKHLPGCKSKTTSPYLSYDPDGQIARSGKTDRSLLDKLNELPYYRQSPPKSLGEEWVDECIWPLLNQASLPLEDKLHTYCHHVGIQLSASFGEKTRQSILLSGGGAHNPFLIECLEQYLPQGSRLVIPNKQTVDFKEALVFAFLGVLCQQQSLNCLASVTGASRNSVTGSLHFGEPSALLDQHGNALSDSNAHGAKGLPGV